MNCFNRIVITVGLSTLVLAQALAGETTIPLTEKVYTRQGSELRLINALRDYIPHVMREKGTPGLNLALGHKGNLIWEAGFGYADVADKKKMTPDTVYHSGSLGKTYTATAIMQLVEQGVIKLDEDISQYLPFKVKNPLGERPVTVRDLMTHRSGLQTDPGGSEWSRPRPLVDMLTTLYEKGEVRGWGKSLWQAKVGEKWSYSNPGIATLGLMVEMTNPEKLSFADYVQKHIMDPLGMSSSQYPPAQHKDFVRPDIWKQMSTGYARMGSVWIPTLPVYIGHYPAGGALQKPSDHLRLLMAMMDEGKYNGFQVLKPETVKQMLSPMSAGGGENIIVSATTDTFQGLVWCINKIGQQAESFDHAGGHMFGWTTQGRAWPNLDLSIMIAENQWTLPERERAWQMIVEFIETWKKHELPEVNLKPTTKDWSWKVSYVRGVVFAIYFNGLGAGDMPKNELMDSIESTRVQPGWRNDWDEKAFQQGVLDITDSGFNQGISTGFWMNGKSKVSMEVAKIIMKELGHRPESYYGIFPKQSAE